ncbi:pilus assembly protein [Acinetobacter lanii]|uniref:Pilus assembly protein PilC n=1 Tax=Acinetobacter lanii TaxID=2715163 RepID=A0A6G8S7Q4_9GAMM|nr:PilC/PilY family type IV pilus protein [Acinetobacter lanii]QIO09963.1 pilus assembly protein PilC [Acinetobacter lanii]
MKTLNKKVLSATVSALMTLGLCGSMLAFASDIEIYKDAQKGKTSILLMLDTSGSMGISSLVLPKNNLYGSPGDVDKSLCGRVEVDEKTSGSATYKIYEWAYNLKAPNTNHTAIKKTVTIGTTVIPYYVRGCTKDGITQYDRLSRLKDAILPLLASNELDDNVIMGLGQFSSKTELTIGTASNRLTDGHSGRILVANKPLDNNQRIKIAQEIALIKSLDTTTNEDGTPNANLKLSSSNYPNVTKASSGTPTAHAYAEAGAYMMGAGTGNAGTNTGKVSTIYDGYMVMQNGTSQVYFNCVEVGNTNTTTLGATVKQCVNNWPAYDSANKTVTTGTISGKVYKPDGKGGWLQVYTQNAFKSEVGNMESGWETFSKLPLGWRYGGWMRVANEPLDIEPIVGTVWTGYAGGTIGIVSYRTNPFLVSGTIDSLIGGFAFSNSTDIKNGAVYRAGGSTNVCDGNGIYFLTDGAPNSTKDDMAKTIMNQTLGTNYQFLGKPSGTGVLVSPTLQSGLFAGETGGWEYIGEYAKKMRNRTSSNDTQKNQMDMNIKTAVVGFGSSFAGMSKNADGTFNCDSAPNLDAKNACLWGSSEYGDGGFYYAENSEDIKKSIIDFVKKTEVTIDPVATGSPSIPVDSLNPVQLQPYGYYSSFTPKPQEKYQLWVGNLNKYDIYNGELGRITAKDGEGNIKFTSLITSTGAINQNIEGLWSGGALQQLKLGTSLAQTSKRRILTNRVIDAAGVVNEKNSLAEVNLLSLFGVNDQADYANDPAKNYWLNLLGYKVDIEDTALSLQDLLRKSELRQIGSVMHSTPLLLTQEGKIEYAHGEISTNARKDYLMFGSTQGVLHVLNGHGEEVFAFVPHEMMEKQKEAFIAENLSNGGKEHLFYGIDGPWTAFTQYVSKADGTLTVHDAERKKTDDSDSLNVKGLQWVYGGLRMGGRSYYALDLSDIEKPSLKFHIDPDAQDASLALQQMGQSWSKPTLAYVKWKGEKKLVMFVGGGYDTAYEQALNNPNTSKGNGVYMFDAENGELLWWASSTAATGADQQTLHNDLKYSVVTQINAIDRDADGLVDHLYFGDLGGQAFRVDLDNSQQDAKNFAKRVVLLFSQHRDVGTSPRFYEMPSISVHKEDGDYFVVAAFSSGNRSSPLVDHANSANDGVFVVFDNDVTRADLLNSNTLITQNVTLDSLVLSTGISRKNSNGQYNGGWKYHYSDIAGRYKGMNELYALDNMLYVNVFDKDGAGIGGSCGAGVTGDSHLYQFCLPSGKCDFYPSTITKPYSVKLGAGILGTGFGQGYNNANNTVGLVVNRDDATGSDCMKPENKNLPQCQIFNNKVSLKQLRWYESQ